MLNRSRKAWIFAAALVGFIALIGIGGKALTQSSVPSIPGSSTIFASLESRLTQSGVPLRLPTYIPSRGQRLNEEGSPPTESYATIERLSNGRYEINVGYSKDCSGGNACRLATVSGEQKTAQTKPIEEVYSFMKDPNFKGIRSSEPMVPVTLSQNHAGWFIPWICGANCNDAKVVWDEDRYRYLVAIKLGAKSALIEMANSAIDAQS